MTDSKVSKDAKDIPSNMQGVAYESQVLFIATELGDPPADGDYVPTTIQKYDWSYYDQSEANLYNEYLNFRQLFEKYYLFLISSYFGSLI